MNNKNDVLLFNAITDYLSIAKEIKNIYTELKSKIGEKVTKSKSTETIHATKTCGWCLGQFAIHNTSVMWRHGYKHGGGYSYGLCPGSRFKCLEVSNEALVAYIDYCDIIITKCEKSLKKLPTMIEIANPKFDPKNPKKVPPTILKSDVPVNVWNKLVVSTSHNFNNKIHFYTASRTQRNNMLEKWQAT